MSLTRGARCGSILYYNGILVVAMIGVGLLAGMVLDALVELSRDRIGAVIMGAGCQGLGWL